MSTTNARLRRTYLGRREDDPAVADLEGGEIWFNTTTSEYRGFDGTDIGSLGFTPDV